MKTLGNILWFILGGWIAGTIWVLMGALCYVTIIGIPFGTACFRIASFAYFPFGKELVDARDVGEGRIAMTGLGNFLWVVLFGLWNSIFFVLAGIAMCCGIVTIPFGFAYFKLAAAGFAPLGKRIVSTDMARVIRERKASGELDRRTGRGGDDGLSRPGTGRVAGGGAASSLASWQPEWDRTEPEEPEELEEEDGRGDEAQWVPPEEETEVEEEEGEEEEDETGGDIFLLKVRLGRKLDAALKESLPGAERGRLEKIRDLYLAGVEAQQAGEKEAAGALYRRAEKGLAEWRKGHRVRRTAPPAVSPTPARGSETVDEMPSWAPMAGIAVLAAVVVGFFLWKQGELGALPSRTARRDGSPHPGAGEAQTVGRGVPAEPPLARGAWDGTYTGAEREVSLPRGATMTLKWCPAGSYTMGSPAWEEGRYNDEVQHEVTLTRGFWMAETEVTQGQWKALMNGETVADLARKGFQDDTGYDFNDGKGAITMRERWGMKRGDDPMGRCGDLDDAVPVYNVSWGEAREFCRRLTEKGRNEGWLPAGYSFRLPTEAEWEYACRAGTKTALPNGQDIRILGDNNAPALDGIAWYGGNSSVGFEGSRAADTSTWPDKQYPGGRAWARKVGLKAANDWGLRDMIGNVWEWCEDEFAGYPTGAVTDYCKSNSSTALGVHRVVRGGSWNGYARLCRSAFRDWKPAGFRDGSVGFRPVCSAGL